MSIKHQLAFVLSGGGARGALQVGALQALLEAGFAPDLLVGTSAGAINAALLSCFGFDRPGIERLTQVWLQTIQADLMPTHFLWHTTRALFKHANGLAEGRLRSFAIAHGLDPQLRFKDLEGSRLFLVAADLNTGKMRLYGQDPQDFVLEGVLASAAVLPWYAPLEENGRCLVDGGVISNLPIEAALSQGADEIIALDLFDRRDFDASEQGVRSLLWKLVQTVECR